MHRSPLIPITTLGTAQSTTLPEPAAECLEEVWKSIDTSDLPLATLQAAALEQSLYSTGVDLITAEHSSSQAPTCSSDPLPSAAVDSAVRMIKGDHSECLTEWFALSAKVSKVAPAYMLPTLLDYGAKHKDDRSAIAQLVSKRGVWLARQYSEWNWLANPDPPEDENSDEQWQTGSSAQRLRYLSELQCQAPSSAASLIQDTWKDEAPEFKVHLISLIASEINSIHHHEVWLQSAANDPRKEVRALATAALLSFKSDYRYRATERAKAFISVKKNTIVITQPEEFDKDWIRDGIKKKIPAGSTKIKGEKAGWLRQILARVPLTDWQLMLNTKTPLHKLKPDPDWEELIHVTQHEAAIHTSDLDSLLEHIKHHADDSNLSILLSTVTKTFTSDQTYEFLSKLPTSLPPHLTLYTLQTLKQPATSPQPKITALILKHLLAKESSIYANQARLLALCIHTEEIPSTLKKIAKQKLLTGSAEEFANLLEFRQSYINSFT